MQITTLGPLAVDGRPIRGERLITLVRELVGARGRAVSTTSRVGAAVLYLRRAVARSSGADVDAAVTRPREAGPHALSSVDLPVLGS